MPEVNSSMLRSIDWKPDVDVQELGAGEPEYDASGKLTLTFHRGKQKTYVLSNVPKFVFEEFMAAPSKGRYFRANIKGRYP